MGQPPHHSIQVQCSQHPISQSNNSLLKPRIVARRRKHLFKALKRCNYSTWTINRARMKSQNPNRNRTRKTQIQTGQNSNKQNLCMVVPYHQGPSERIKKTCNKFWLQVHFKGGQTIKSLLMAPKDKDPITNKSGVIHR